MDLIIEPDTYEPSINDDNNYVDYLPSTNKFKHGLRCPCGTRKEHVYDNKQCFSIHIKSKTHQKWLSELNYNKTNYFTENIKLKDTIQNQKLIIAKLQRENYENTKLITHLTKKLEMKESNIVYDLLDFD